MAGNLSNACESDPKEKAQASDSAQQLEGGDVLASGRLEVGASESGAGQGAQELAEGAAQGQAAGEAGCGVGGDDEDGHRGERGDRADPAGHQQHAAGQEQKGEGECEGLVVVAVRRVCLLAHARRRHPDGTLASGYDLPQAPAAALVVLRLGSVFKDDQVVDHGRVIRRHELTDLEWELLAPLIPRAATGRPRVPDRQVINGMVYKIRTGVSWRDLPERYGPWQTVYTRFRRYALDGVFTRALQQIQAGYADAVGDIDWLVQIDSTIVRAHQHSAATGRKGGSTGRTNRTITPSADPEAD